jgi:lipoprotein-anchoring transpeptidase ErfK/SrfK
VRRRDGWLGVIATEVPNGRLAWVRASATRPAVSTTRILVDLSRRRPRVVGPHGRTLLRVTVGVGAANTPTPTGRFAITDGLRTEPGSPYGCCILALSGHQPNVPQGWTGGDRLAIHGTDDPASIGAAASSGCLRATDEDVRRLMARVGLGALVEIRA